MPTNPRAALLLTCFFSAAALLQGCGGRSGHGALVDAQREYANGEYGAALVRLRNMLDESPNDASVLLLLASTQTQRGEWDEAEKALAKSQAAGARAGDVADVRARILLEKGDAKALLTLLDSGSSELASDRIDYYRARMLMAVGRIPEALQLFRALSGKGGDEAEIQARIAQGHAILGRTSAAREAIALATSRAPGSAEGWLLLASLEEQSGNHAAAEAALEKALLAAPGQLSVARHAAVLSQGIQAALSRSDTAAASRYFDALAKVAPQAYVTELLSAELKLAKGENAAAVASLQRLMQEQPKLQRARAVLVAGLLSTGSMELALKELTNLTSRDTEMPAEQLMLAQVRKAAGLPVDSVDRSLAVAAVQLALDAPYAARGTLASARAKHPDAVPLAIGAAQVELRTGSPDAAAAQIQPLLQRIPANQMLQAAWADIRLLKGDYAGARATYESLMAAAPNQVLSLSLARARKLAKQGDALEPLKTWSSAHPEDAVVRIALAEMLTESGNMSAAIREYEEALKLRSNDPILMNNLASLYQRAGDGRALALAKRSYDLAGSLPQVADTYGWLLVQSGEAAKGLPILQKAAQALPMSAVIRYHLAAALVRTGSEQEARALLEDLLSDPADLEWKADAERLLASLQSPTARKPK